MGLRKLVPLAILVVAVVASSPAGSDPFAACQALAGGECEFEGDGTELLAGSTAATNAEWKIERLDRRPPQVVMSGVGPNAEGYVFLPGVRYRVTVGDGVGFVTAANGWEG
jgi:hypothetical protein